MMHGPGPGGPRHGGQFLNERDKGTKINYNKLKRIVKYFTKYKLQLILLLFTIIVIAVLDVIPALLVKEIIDNSFPNKDLNLLIILVVIYFIVVMLSNLIGVLQAYINSKMTESIICDIRYQTYENLQSLPIEFFSNRKIGEILSCINNDIGGIQSVFQSVYISVFRNIFIFIVTAVTLFFTNWILAIVSIIILPFFIIPTKKVSRKRFEIAKRNQWELEKINNIVSDTLNVSGATLVKLFSRENDKLAEFQSVNQEVGSLNVKAQIVGRWFFMFLSIFTTLGPLLIYLVGGILLIQYDMLTIGGIVLFVSLLGRLYGPITEFTNIHVDIVRSFALFDRIFGYLDVKSSIVEAQDAVEIADMKGDVEFKHVYFRYDSAIENNLSNISFKVNRGQMLAVVGPSGAGKSTITKLLPRLYDYESGVISIDGIDIKQIKIDNLRKNISFVTQDTYLFNESIRYNLLFAKKDASEEELISACKAAYIHDLIMTLPRGYDTIVGERGVKLSGGEKQRISIARAILTNPSILIFDEATSSLDSESEKYIQLAINPLLKNKTSIIVAHRLSTIMNADNIIVIDDGEVVECGNHQQLINNDGLYKVLYDTQFMVENEEFTFE